MPRYIKQRDNYSCGPVALINAARWSGSKEKIRSLRKRFMSECECTFPGTSLGNFKKVINEIDCFKIHSMCKQPSIGRLDYNLDVGRIVILRIRSELGGHYFLCTRYTSEEYEVINYNAECKTIFKIPKNFMSESLKYIDSSGTSIAWFIEKNGD